MVRIISFLTTRNLFFLPSKTKLIHFSASATRTQVDHNSCIFHKPNKGYWKLFPIQKTNIYFMLRFHTARKKFFCLRSNGSRRKNYNKYKSNFSMSMRTASKTQSQQSKHSMDTMANTVIVVLA